MKSLLGSTLLLSLALGAFACSAEAVSSDDDDDHTKAASSSGTVGGASSGTGGSSGAADPDALAPHEPGAAYTQFGTDGVAVVGSNAVTSIVSDASGHVLVSDGETVSRLSETGVLDATYTQKRAKAASGDWVSGRLLRGADGTIYHAGSRVSSKPGGGSVGITRLTETGDLDATFGDQGVAAATFDAPVDSEQLHAAIGSGGTFAIGGSGRYQSATEEERKSMYVAHLDASGSVLGIYAVPFGERAQLDSIVVQDDGKIVFGGVVGEANARAVVGRLGTDGTLDSAFGDGGIVELPDGENGSARDLALSSDGRIVVVFDAFPGVQVARLEADGSIDGGFGNGGATVLSQLDYGVYATPVFLLVQPDDRIVVAAAVESNDKSDARAARLQADGTLDEDFGQLGLSRPFSTGTTVDRTASAALLPNGLVLLGGQRIVQASATDDVKSSGFLFALAP